MGVVVVVGKRLNVGNVGRVIEGIDLVSCWRTVATCISDKRKAIVKCGILVDLMAW